MGNQAVQRQPAVAGQRGGGIQVLPPPLRRDPQPRFLHEGGREGERQPLGIEPGQHDLPARRQMPHQRVQQPGVAAGVVDRAVVAARVVLGRDHRVFRRHGPRRVALPHRRRRGAMQDREPGQQPAQHAMPDDQVRQRVRRCQRMLRGGGQGQQDRALAQRLRHGHDALGRHDQMRGGGAEQAAHALEAGGAGDEHKRAFMHAAGPAHDAARRLVAGHQRVTHSGEGRHAAGVEQALGAAADTAPARLDNDVADAGR